MAYSCRILADSGNIIGRKSYRLTTFEISFPRMVLAEFNTHTVLSRNSASSRAIPVKKQLRLVLDDPYIPFFWGKNVPGMQAPEQISAERIHEAEAIWLRARNKAALSAMELLAGTVVFSQICRDIYGFPIGEFTDLSMNNQLVLLPRLIDSTIELLDDAHRANERLDVHKQLANRLLEPFMWHRVITTGTEWDNFFALRCHNDAQPEIRVIAEMMRDLYGKTLPGDSASNRADFAPYREWLLADHSPSTPKILKPGEWHTPLMSEEQRQSYGVDWDIARDISVGRCARVSYLTHEGREDWEADVELAERLRGSGHMSPYQHVGTPMHGDDILTLVEHFATSSAQQITQYDWSGNFRGFKQYRKLLPHEYDFTEVRELEFS